MGEKINLMNYADQTKTWHHLYYCICINSNDVLVDTKGI